MLDKTYLDASTGFLLYLHRVDADSLTAIKFQSRHCAYKLSSVNVMLIMRVSYLLD